MLTYEKKKEESGKIVREQEGERAKKSSMIERLKERSYCRGGNEARGTGDKRLVSVWKENTY